MKRDDYFCVAFDHFGASSIFEAAGRVTQIGSNLKPNNHNQVKLVQIPDMLCKKGHLICPVVIFDRFQWRKCVYNNWL